MKFITAPDNYNPKKDDIILFLAGGITACEDWQSKLKEKFENPKDEKVKEALENVIIFNPRQSNFDVTNPNAADEQIEWEHKYLNMMDVFTMWFSGDTESPQPICFYELGKYKERMINKHGKSHCNYAMCIGVSPTFKRKKDVHKQCELDNVSVYEGNLDGYFASIIDCIMSIKVFRNSGSDAVKSFL